MRVLKEACREVELEDKMYVVQKKKLEIFLGFFLTCIFTNFLKVPHVSFDMLRKSDPDSHKVK